jgi:hypothetical protein
MSEITEVLRLFDEWGRNFAPKDFIQSEANAIKLYEHVIKTYGLVTISYLIAGEKALGNQLERTPAPKVKTADELAAEEAAHQYRDYMDSIKPQPSFEERVKAEKAKRLAAEAAKAQEDAKSQLALAISGYQCYRVNGAGIDYTATEMMQKELRSVRVGNDFVRALAVVRQIITELPDHPKMGDVARVVESLNARSVKPEHQRKDSFGSDVKEAGKLGGLR